MPIMIGGFGNILIPVIVGGQDMVFPRLNAFSFWLVAAATVLMMLATVVDNGVGCG